eukprot:7039497-Pyramimonas_sp.AAC.1
MVPTKPNMIPRRLQDGPRRPTTAKDGPQDTPRGFHEASATAPEASKRFSRNARRGQKHRFPFGF